MQHEVNRLLTAQFYRRINRHLDVTDRIQLAIQRLTEAIWNLDQLQPLERGLEEEYRPLQLARGNLMKHVEKDGSA